MLNDECEFLVLASDGVWDVMSNQRSTDIVRKVLVECADPEAAARKVVEEAKVQDSRDNITAAVLALRPLPLPPKKPLARKYGNSRLRLASSSVKEVNTALDQAQNEVAQCPLGI